MQLILSLKSVLVISLNVSTCCDIWVSHFCFWAQDQRVFLAFWYEFQIDPTKDSSRLTGWQLWTSGQAWETLLTKFILTGSRYKLTTKHVPYTRPGHLHPPDTVISQRLLFPFTGWENKFPLAGKSYIHELWNLEYCRLYFLLFFTFIVCMHVHEHWSSASGHASEHQRVAYRNGFFPSTMWVLEIELGLPGLLTSALCHEAIGLVGFCQLETSKVGSFWKKDLQVRKCPPHWSVVLINGRWGRVCPIGGSATPCQVVLEATIKWTKQAVENKPGSHAPLWPLLQFLLLSSGSNFCQWWCVT